MARFDQIIMLSETARFLKSLLCLRIIYTRIIVLLRTAIFHAILGHH